MSPCLINFLWGMNWENLLLKCNLPDGCKLRCIFKRINIRRRAVVWKHSRWKHNSTEASIWIGCLHDCVSHFSRIVHLNLIRLECVTNNVVEASRSKQPPFPQKLVICRRACRDCVGGNRSSSYSFICLSILFFYARQGLGDALCNCLVKPHISQY